jgi:hypothetical protein
MGVDDNIVQSTLKSWANATYKYMHRFDFLLQISQNNGEEIQL